MHDDIIICGNFTRDVFKITKVQTKTNILQHLGNVAFCYKDLLVLITSSSFTWRHNLKKFIFKNLTKNSFNNQKISILSLTNRFLDRGGKFAPPPVQIACKNSPVCIGIYMEVDYTEINNGLLLWCMMLQNHLKYYKVNAKI